MVSKNQRQNNFIPETDTYKKFALFGLSDNEEIKKGEGRDGNRSSYAM